MGDDARNETDGGGAKGRGRRLPPYTADELRAAVRLVDPVRTLPASFYETAAEASAAIGRPHLLPPLVLVALTLVSARVGRAADAWLGASSADDAAEGDDAAARAWFVREREALRRVARGELPPPGLAG